MASIRIAALGVCHIVVKGSFAAITKWHAVKKKKRKAISLRFMTGFLGLLKYTHVSGGFMNTDSDEVVLNLNGS
ncbi:hypothetical protein GCM10027516_16570 [Niabella aquatica]